MANVSVNPERLMACRVLYEVYEKGTFSNETLLRHLRFSGLEAQQRAFVRALVYGTLTRTLTVDWRLDSASSRPIRNLDPWVRTILRLGCWQLDYAYAVPPHAACHEAGQLCRYFGKEWAVSYVNAVLRHLSQTPPAFHRKDEPLRLGLKPEMYGCLKKWYGEEAAQAIAEEFLQEEDFLSIRANRRKIAPDQLMEELLKEGAQVEKSPYLENSLRVRPGGKPMTEWHSFQKGQWIVQGEPAQVCGYLFGNPSSSQTVVDLCAAPGGKTTDLGERLPAGSHLVAVDVSGERLNKCRENSQRLGISMTYVEADATQESFQNQLRCQTGIGTGESDFVLADVPCSGLGLMGRKPEIRLRMGYEDLERFLPIQQAILRQGSRLVRPGGRLLYSTCTLNPAENQEQIKAFLQSPEGRAFRISPLMERLPEPLSRVIQQELYCCSLLQEGFLLFRPDVTRTEGFFIAELHRREA